MTNMMNYAELSDVELQMKAVSGDREAEEMLASRYMQLVRACARPFFLAGGDSEDLIQEGTFGLVSAIRQYSQTVGASFKTFAEHCIKMRLISAVKSASRLKHFPLNDSLSLEQLSNESNAHMLVSPDRSLRNPEDLVLARESKEELFNAFSDCLSGYEKKVLRLYLEGLSYRDIANALDRDEHSVDNAVQRIRRKMARSINSGEISIS